MSKEPRIRRSAGMLKSPRDVKTPSFPATQPKARPQSQQPQRVSASPYPAPKVLMGEVTAPRGVEIGLKREAFRAFMLARHLRPTEWARAAGVAPGEILGFLTGKARNIAPATLEKLAHAANCVVDDFFADATR
ncbi:MAG TPA: helix-turn-helix transcriptional regulator [Rhizomicrobium sp.]|nr:helix-turn-helix transcriptional regulator [Rhizomicrobium sp.]